MNAQSGVQGPMESQGSFALMDTHCQSCQRLSALRPQSPELQMQPFSPAWTSYSTSCGNICVCGLECALFSPTLLIPATFSH